MACISQTVSCVHSRLAESSARVWLYACTRSALPARGRNSCERHLDRSRFDDLSPAGVLTLDFSHASLVRAGRITDTIRRTEVVDT